MNMKYDAQTDALYIGLSEGKYKVTKKITDAILVDVTKEGKVLGIEILDASETIQHFDPKTIHLTLQRANIPHRHT